MSFACYGKMRDKNHSKLSTTASKLGAGIYVLCQRQIPGRTHLDFSCKKVHFVALQYSDFRPDLNSKLQLKIPLGLVFSHLCLRSHFEWLAHLFAVFRSDSLRQGCIYSTVVSGGCCGLWTTFPWVTLPYIKCLNYREWLERSRCWSQSSVTGCSPILHGDPCLRISFRKPRLRGNISYL